jgi:hypothetical protein
MAWRRARRGGWLAVRVAALLALPASAPAEPIATLGHGANPSAVVDAAGTLHAVWDRTGIGDRGDSTMYCRLPAGATSCQSVSLPDLPVGTPPAYQASILLRPADGALFVVVYVAPPSTRCGSTRRSTAARAGARRSRSPAASST